MAEREGPAKHADFGEQPAAADATTSGGAIHRPGYVESPARVAGAADKEGAATPQRMRFSGG